MNAVTFDHINEAIRKVSKFITPLIPLASCHMVDYISANHWETLLPEQIRKDLLNVPRDQLQHLPSASLAFDDTDAGNRSSDWSMSSSDLPSFLSAIRNHSLPSLGVTTTVDEILQNYGSEEISTPSMKGVMSDKKSHEVEMMGQVITRLAKGCGVEWIVDIGSGKGYLSTALVLQYGLNVIAIDSSSTNTSSAVTRKTKLQKYWKYIRKTEQERALGKPVKKGKHWRRLKSLDASTTDSASTDCVASQNDKNVGKHIAITAYVSEDTDLLQVVKDCINTEKDNIIDSVNGSVSSENKEQSETIDNSDLYTENLGRTEADNFICNGDAEKHELHKDNITDLHPDTTLKNRGIFSEAPEKDCISTFEQNADAKTTDESDSRNIKTDFQLGLVGLHTCGNLAPSSLRIYSSNSKVTFLCNIGCCYHLLEEEFSRNPFLDYGKENPSTSAPSQFDETAVEDLSLEKCSIKQETSVNIMHPSEIPNLSSGFPLCKTLREAKFSLGRNSRMLSCQPADRLNYKDLSSTVALYWRSLLQVLLLEKLGDVSDIAHVGRIAAKCHNFSEYVRTAVKKLNLNIEVSDEELQEYSDVYAHHLGKLERFFFLRASLAPIIEGLILLDRLAYLYEQGIGSAYMVQLFDPVTSPRCHAIIAFRKSASDCSGRQN